MIQLYWQVYLNLEREFLGLADAIYINDSQQEVYSMRIADLLIRTVIEIESLSKELYLSNGGVAMPDKDLFFDTGCLSYLNTLWKLDQKVVLVSSPNIYFEREENKILRPLRKADKRGSSSSDWNKAYQAVKHNRVKELSKGNLKHLLHGLAALYVLNLYYNNRRIDNLSNKDKSNVDSGFGSSLFAVKIHHIDLINYQGIYIKKSDYDECVYLEDYEVNSMIRYKEATGAMGDYLKQKVSDEINKIVKEEIAKGNNPSSKWIEQKKKFIINEEFSKKKDILSKMNESVVNMRYNIVLNRHQY